jgi:hypothetical protein
MNLYKVWGPPMIILGLLILDWSRWVWSRLEVVDIKQGQDAVEGKGVG